MFQSSFWWFQDVLGGFKGRFRVFHRFFKGLKGFKGDSKAFQKIPKGFREAFQRRFKVNDRRFQRRFKGSKGMLHDFNFENLKFIERSLSLEIRTSNFDTVFFSLSDRFPITIFTHFQFLHNKVRPTL